MRRLVLAAAAVAACVGAGVQIASDDDVADARRVAEVVPFPRTTTPLPVPEVTIEQGPWRDEPPFASPSTAPRLPDGFTARCTGSTSPCAVTERSGAD
ncbi:hypothetical protein [Aeromicrobium sp. Root472D3]|uniref:hypothetical protein n=1 Tax=Aeromicrobium sp. Root472D3 TaxID=1736540 RepID=UPI0006FD10AB|nr:hypothetical protein [Aeromicrobium sp. Root472D3]KQX75985.1 hypothetical protein ASD10_12865 [Aeromicrobium sp. Root472D3]